MIQFASDPFVAFLDDDVNDNSSKQVRKAIDTLLHRISGLGIAVIGVRHLNKNVAVTNAKYRGGGSIGITGVARSVLLTIEDPDHEGQCLVAVAKKNLAPPEMCKSFTFSIHSAWVPSDDPESPIETSRIEWGQEDPRVADELLAAVATSAQKKGQQANLAEKLLRDMLANKDWPANEARIHLARDGIKGGTLDRAKALEPERSLNVLSATTDSVAAGSAQPVLGPPFRG
jgi:hypothetical protein